MHKVMLRGSAAEVRYGYQRAAVIGPWTISTRPEGATLTATVVSSDAFRMSQPSLTFVVSRQSAAPWIWPVESLQLAGTTLIAQLGSQEDGHERLRTAGDRPAAALGRRVD